MKRSDEHRATHGESRHGPRRSAVAWFISATVAGGAWLILAALPALADGGPHVSAINNGSLGINADSCAGCHRAHTAQGPFLLNAADEDALCLTCHGAFAAGATTDVMTGLQYRIGTDGLRDAGIPLGALRGGGFDQARIDPLGAARLSYTTGGGAIEFVAKVPVGPPLDVTSAHLDLDDGDGVVASGIAWGNGQNSSDGPGPTVELSCVSCHNPHGNGQYRILNPIPNPAALSGVLAPVGAPGALITDSPVDNPDPAESDVKNYTVIQTKGTPSDITTYLLYADDVLAAGHGPTTGDYFHRYVPWNATLSSAAIRSYDAPNGRPTSFGTQMNAWCAACHTRYPADDPILPREDASGVEDPIFRYQHQTRPVSDGAVCLTCHVSHGSNAVMSGTYSATMPFPDGSPKFLPSTTTIVPDSRLLKFNNRGTCQACHDPTGTIADGAYEGPILMPGVP